MQFFTLVVAAASVATVLAAPVDVSAQNDVQQCQPNQTAQCCDSLQFLNPLLGVLPIGIGCLPLLGSCANKAACCSGKPQQFGLININLECTQIL